MPAGDAILTIAGNLTADPALRYTTAGVAVAAFTVASSPRIYDQASGQWKDGDPLFMRCSAWRDLAEHVAESLTKGTRVVVTGRLRQRAYETAEGDKRTVYEIDADDVGASLRWANAKITRTARQQAPSPAASAGEWAPGQEPPF